MPKVTVYVSDDQLDQLKAVRGFGRGGVSKLFQAFLESATSGSAPSGRYDYARKLMPLHAAVERHRRRLARKVAAGGPPADGGPVAAALAILLYRKLVDEDPARATAFEKEFARFGLDELVAAETEGVDLTAEPEEDEEIEEDGDLPDFLLPLGNMRWGETVQTVQEALKGVQAFKLGLHDFKDIKDLKDLKRLKDLEGKDERTFRRVAEREARRRAGRGRIRVRVSSDDDPRDVLTVADYDTFRSRHDDWKPGDPLSPSQMETVRELLIVRAGGDPSTDDGDAGDDDEVEVEVAVETAAAAEAPAAPDEGGAKEGAE